MELDRWVLTPLYTDLPYFLLQQSQRSNDPPLCTNSISARPGDHLSLHLENKTVFNGVWEFVVEDQLGNQLASRSVDLDSKPNNNKGLDILIDGSRAGKGGQERWVWKAGKENSE